MRLYQLLANLLVFLKLVAALSKPSTDATDDVRAPRAKSVPRKQDYYQDVIVSYESQIVGSIALNLIWDETQVIFTSYHQGLSISSPNSTSNGINTITLGITGTVALIGNAWLTYGNDWQGTLRLDTPSGSISNFQVITDDVTVSRGSQSESVVTSGDIVDQGTDGTRGPDTGTLNP